MPISQQQADQAVLTLPPKVHIESAGLKAGPSTTRIIITEKTLHLLVDINHLFKRCESGQGLTAESLINIVEVYRQQQNVQSQQVINGNFILAMIMSKFTMKVNRRLDVRFLVTVKREEELFKLDFCDADKIGCNGVDNDKKNN